MPDKPPTTISADALSDIIDQEADGEDEDEGNGSSTESAETATDTDATESPAPPAQEAAPNSSSPAPAQQPLQVVEVRRFGPPDRIPTTDEILGRSFPKQEQQQPSPPSPDSMRPADGRATRDPLAEDRERPEKKGKNAKDAAEVALRNLLKEYPSTKLVNVRIFWRNPRTGEYRYKGSRKNVDINEIRRPDNIVAPYGKDWIVSFQPIEARWDDPKSWQSFQFDRDGPEPKEDWTIDAPPADGLFLEVDGMGQLGMNDLKELITAGSKSAVQDMMRQIGMIGPQGQVQLQPQYMQQQPFQQPPYMQPPPPPPPPAAPVRDAAAEEREKELRETIKRLETGLQGIAERAANAERAAAERIQKAEQDSRDRVHAAEKERLEAQHKAEVEALKSSFQSALEGSKTAMEAIANKLAAVEAKANQPPPPPPPPAPQTDFAQALIQVAPHIKDIFSVRSNADAEAARVREQAMAAERQREADERAREREREREERERERERRRQEEDRNREEMRERREAFERENMRMREEAQRTLDLYRTLGEQSANNARMIADMFGKQSDPSGTMSVIKMATDSMTQQMQLFAAMVKNGILGGGGPQQAAFDWGRFAEQGLNMLGNVGSAYAESKARASQQAARAAQAMTAPSPSMAGLSPQMMPQQQQAPAAAAPRPRPVASPPMAGQAQPQPQQPQQPPAGDTVDVNPLTPFVHGVNQSIAKKEPPEKVADKIAGIVHIAQSFGELEKNRTLKALMENPETFLKRAYPDAEPDYLMAIAQQLIEMFPPEGEENEEEEGGAGEEGTEGQEPEQAQPPPQQAQPTPPQPTPVARPQAVPQVVLVDAEAGNGGQQPATVVPAQAQVRRGPGRPRRHVVTAPVAVPPQVATAQPTPQEPPTPPPEPEPPTGTPSSGTNAG